MRMRLRTSTVALMCFTAVAAWATHVELRAFTQATDIARSDTANVEFVPEIGLSLLSTQVSLLSCDTAISPTFSAFRTTRQRQATAHNCASFAKAVLQLSPTHGFAHFIASASDHEIGDRSGRLLALRRSIQHAPFEGWIAERRFALAVRVRDLELLDAVEPDIRTLLSTQSGAELLARYYDQTPDLARRINQAFLSVSSHEEQRFINLLRRRFLS